MDGREVGYIKLFRSVESSEDFIGLRADQCWIAVRLIQLANFKPGFTPFRGQAVEVGRGELAHTLETIATRTHSTVKVVRTTVARLLRSGFLGSRTGTVAGTPYRILIVRNYERYQGDAPEAGTVTGMATGSDRAATGHVSGSDRALREEGKEGKKGKKPSLASAPPPPESDPRFQPFIKAAFDVFAEVRGGVALDLDGHDGKRLKDFLSRQPRVTVEDFSARWRKALGMARYPGCAKVAHLVERWNEFAGPGPVSSAPVTAIASDHSTFQGGRRVV